LRSSCPGKVDDHQREVGLGVREAPGFSTSTSAAAMYSSISVAWLDSTQDAGFYWRVPVNVTLSGTPSHPGPVYATVNVVPPS
jgi:hypothetical protein